MIVGSRVICVNDSFPDWFRKLAKRCPIKGNTYLIRSVKLEYENTDETSATVGILLTGIHNSVTDREEPAFSYHRFKLIDHNISPSTYDRE